MQLTKVLLEGVPARRRESRAPGASAAVDGSPTCLVRQHVVEIADETGDERGDIVLLGDLEGGQRRAVVEPKVAELAAILRAEEVVEELVERERKVLLRLGARRADGAEVDVDREGVK